MTRLSQGALLVAFCAQVVVTQVLWLTFSPVARESAAALDVGLGAIGDLTAVNPVVFVALAVLAGRWLDRALVPTLVAGAVATAAGAVLRAAVPDSFAVVLTGQVVLSVGQPLVLGATTAVAARYLLPGWRTGAIAAASASQLVGILVAALLAAPTYAAVGLAGTLRLQAGLAVAVAVGLVVLACTVPPREEPTPVVRGAVVWRDGFVLALAAVLFVGVGVFNAVATWLDALLGAGAEAGPLIALTTATGIVGSVLLPPWVARHDRRRELLLVAGAVTALGFALCAVVGDPRVVGVVLAVVGFVLLPGLPVALEWAELRLGADVAARTTSALLLAGNVGGVVLVVGLQPVVDRPPAALGLLALLVLPAVAAAWTLPRRLPVGPVTATHGGT